MTVASPKARAKCATISIVFEKSEPIISADAKAWLFDLAEFEKSLKVQLMISAPVKDRSRRRPLKSLSLISADAKDVLDMLVRSKHALAI